MALRAFREAVAGVAVVMQPEEEDDEEGRRLMLGAEACVKILEEK